MVASMATLQKPLRVAIKSRALARAPQELLTVFFASLQKSIKIPRSYLWNA
jgi:hypothetical protein